jgi:Aconitase X
MSRINPDRRHDEIACCNRRTSAGFLAWVRSIAVLWVCALDEAEEEALRAGECGEAAQWAIEHQIKVGDYLGARDFVPVTQADIMADTESLGPAGVGWLERLARLPAQARRSPRARRATATTSRNADGRRLSSTSASRRASSMRGLRSAAPRASRSKR